MISWSPPERFGLVVLAFILLALGGCAHRSEPKIHAHGSVGGEVVNTRVDSDLAEYYIEDYSRGYRSNQDLHDQLCNIEQWLGQGIPKREELEWITENYSRDVATAFLVERLASDPINQGFSNSYYQQLDLIISGGVDPSEPSTLKSSVVILVVPGWYWRDRSFDGSLEVPREYLNYHGYNTELLETDDKGSVENNAEVVAHRLRELHDAGQLVVLVSVSKGSAEAAFALGQLMSSEESEHVLAWINVNGGLRGSPLADEMLNWRRKFVTRLGLWFLYRDNGSGLRSMRTARRRQAYDSLQLPPHVLSINVSAVPFSGQVTPRSRDVDRLLNKYGPHDGSVLLRDQLIDDAPTVTEVGYDHYFFDPLIGVKSLALVRVLEEALSIGH